ncbi:MAG TPA: TIM-barrel domain-containing protein, partial [Paludibacter sp.]|nr:TIM-barrel domain-containing protein [Paludibacter sp.]
MLLLLSSSGQAQQINKLPDGVKVNVNSTTIDVKFYSPGIVRICKYPQDKVFDKVSLTVIKQPQKIYFQIQDKDSVFSVLSLKIDISINKTTGKVAFVDKKGERILVENDRGSFTPFNDARASTFSVKQSFLLDPDEAIYGLGQQQQGKLSQRNVRLNMVQGNTDDYIPFFVSTKGYGLFWDNYSPTVFEDNAEGTTFKSDVGDGIDYYFMLGGTLDGSIARMRELTGDVPMFPLWTYGFWQSKERYKSQQEIVGVVSKYRELGVPLDGIIQDWQYWGNNYLWNAMEFLNPEFPNPQ